MKTFKITELPACTAHYSDCAVNNGPALEPGPCDCGGLVVSDKSLVPSDYEIEDKE